ncbi:MAG: hypothetical protein L3K23_10830 [Thermoplasmata archaeon]|nr:hypothetical protein [Thermoplasmata archaeon]
MGRPRRLETRAMVTFGCPVDLHAILLKLAIARGENLSETIRRCLKERIREILKEGQDRARAEAQELGNRMLAAGPIDRTPEAALLSPFAAPEDGGPQP